MPRRQTTGRLRFGPFEVDPRSGELYNHGIKLKLHQQPFKVLIMLLENRGEVVTREQLRARLWPGDTFVAFDKGLDTAIHRLRNVLGDSRGDPRFVETLPRRGYRFVATVEEVFQQVREETTPRHHRSRQLAWASLFLVILAIMTGIFVNRVDNYSSEASRSQRLSSLAVLPLRNLSGDSSQESFADGITEELATDLGKIPGLRVISQTSAARYKGTRKTLQEIARELKVDAVVEGAVLRSGTRVKITTRLVEASTDRQIWAQVYDRDLRDVMALQDEVARSVAQGVRITLSPDEESRFARGRPVDPEAYEAYLNGRHEWSQWTKEGLGKSIEYFKEAVRKDPTYAPAWAGLSDAYGLSVLFGFLPHDEVSAQKEAALKALELDDTLSEAHVALASASLSEWSWSVAEQELRRAIEFDANNATAHQWYGYLLRAEGRHEDAIAEMKIALELDPLTLNKQQSLGATLYLAGHYDEALRRFREMPEGDANMERRHRWMAQIYEQKGMQREAIAELLKLLRLEGKTALAASAEKDYLVAGYSQAKKRLLLAELREIQLRAKHPDSPPLSVDIAGDYALLGVNDKAFEFLEQAFKQHDESLMYLKVDDRFLKLHADSRFQNLVRRMGLPL